jgi:Ion channel
VDRGSKSDSKRSLGLSRAPDERWSHFAERIANAFGFVLILVLAAYVLASLTPAHGWTGALTALVASGAAVVALGGAEARPIILRGAFLLAVAAVVLAALAAITDDEWLLGASGLITAFLLLVAAGAVLRTVVTETEVGFRTILGAISVYTILGLLFTFLYVGLDRIQSSPFFGPGVTLQEGDFLFFSFTTLTTTGYGNLVPAGQPGKMFAGLEMLMGQIFLVTLVAGLVSLWRPGSFARRRSNQG